MSRRHDDLVEEVPPDQRKRALSFLAENTALPRPAEFASPLTTDVRDASLFWSHRDDRILGVGHVPQPVGGLVYLTEPVVAQAADNLVARRLLRRMVAAIDCDKNAQIAQAIAPIEPGTWAGMLESLAFREIGPIELVAAMPDSDRSESDLRLQQAPAADHRVLERVVTATWVDSRDCIGLDDPRSVRDVLCEYAARCGGDLEHWYVASGVDRDVGCLIMDRSRDTSMLDIVYWGVVPAERGRGLGRLVLRAARRVAASEGRMLTALVDRENFPAVRAYRSAGFAVFGSLRLFARHT